MFLSRDESKLYFPYSDTGRGKRYNIKISVITTSRYKIIKTLLLKDLGHAKANTYDIIHGLKGKL